MSDRTATTVLDERAAIAARSLRAQAAARPIPDFDPNPLQVAELPSRHEAAARSWRLPVAAAAAVATLIAGIGTWLVVDGLTDEQAVSSAADPIRPFAATAVPDDLMFAGAADLDAGAGSTDDDTGPFGPLSLYAVDAGDPVLGVVVVHDFDVDDLDAMAAAPVEVAVPGAVAYELGDTGFGVNPLLVLTGSDGVLFLSPTMDRDALVGVATGVAVESDVAVLAAGALPDGWRHLGDEDDAEALLLPLVPLRSTAGSGGPGNAVVYLDASQERVVMVTSGPASDLGLAATTVVAAATERLDVRGRPALLATYPGTDPATGSPVATISWIEADGEVVRVIGLGLAEDELVAVATGVEPVAADEWRELVRRTQLGEFAPELGPDDGQEGGEVVEVARGSFADGTEWVLRAEDGGDGATPDLDVALPAADGSSSSASGSTSEEGADELPPLYAHVETGRGARRFAAGLVADEVAHLVFLDASGVVVGEADPVVGAGYRGWVAEYVGTLVVVAQDAAGDELARVEITPSGSTGSTTATSIDGSG